MLVGSLGRLVRKDVHRWQKARSDAVKQGVLVASAALTVKHQALFRKCHKPGLKAGLGRSLLRTSVY
ncbi:hypothetical protein CEQ51_25795 [Pseudomonas thivervalensis]|uniref:Uncharacterized protein n=1 Tax=Pseudomonas thivervalensis TaxID=86265 RepID=A0A176NKX9_9PSED|nr:hypothetical protein CE140_25795 [Pseudomonas thivervalensis]AXA63338.1 hypothetical protein CEQ51_25795 [Pseudomonas thivervalensis]OAB51713.1 hypothetical protein APS14_25135 [Pseudomonas thivervalensis]